jgi:hypothetical protein
VTFDETLAECTTAPTMSPRVLPPDQPFSTNTHHGPPSLCTVDCPFHEYLVPSLRALCWSCHGVFAILFDSVCSVFGTENSLTLTTVP